MAVAEVPGVTTESVGDAFSKTVLISLGMVAGLVAAQLGGLTTRTRNDVGLFDSRHHRRDRDAAGSRRHRRGAFQRTGRAAGIKAGRSSPTPAVARAALRDADACPGDADGSGVRAGWAPTRRVTQLRSDRAIDQAVVTYFPAPLRIPATTSWNSARTAARWCCGDRDGGDRAGRATRRAGRVHAARLPQRPDRSDAGGSGRRSDRCGDAAAGAGRVRSAQRDADGRIGRSMRRSSI